ncbi:MAG: hypothetical protein R2843_10670 [Thermomicrobiales bacterium]
MPKAADSRFPQAAQELAKFRENDWFMEGYEGADFTTAQALFFQGRAAMIHMGSWLSAEMADVIADRCRTSSGSAWFPRVRRRSRRQNAGFGTAQIFSIARRPSPPRTM